MNNHSGRSILALIVFTLLLFFGLYSAWRAYFREPCCAFPAAENSTWVASTTRMSTPVPTAMRPARLDGAMETLLVLQSAKIPTSNPIDLSCRMGRKCVAENSVPETVSLFKEGDRQTFWVHQLGASQYVPVGATLLHASDHVFFWVEDGVDVQDADVQRLVSQFEERIYPSVRRFFGSEASPGVDGDPHVYILYAKGLGSSVAGYFSPNDTTPPGIQPYSNGHEMFLLNADHIFLDDPYALSVLAHEFQHMVHWANDPSENTWVNEGASELSALLSGYDPGGLEIMYLGDPDIQLNDWPYIDSAPSGPHYGASFLFMTYLFDRIGGDVLQRLVQEPANGLDGVDQVLLGLGSANPAGGSPLTADRLFSDWVAANLVQDPTFGSGQYAYKIFQPDFFPRVAEHIETCPFTMAERSVRQYGADYIEIRCPGNYTIDFQGATAVRLLPADPHSGLYALWSNQGDGSNTRATRQFDFTNVFGPIELSFYLWYDIEENWDYAALLVSTDGASWTPIDAFERSAGPSANPYGFSFTGKTDGWVQKTVDLSAYAGQNVFLRFEYITDGAVYGPGLLVDDISIPAINYFEDFERGDGRWEMEGFARIQNMLPQTFLLSLVDPQSKSVQTISLNPDQSAHIPVSIPEGGSVYLTVSGSTRYTRQEAIYRIAVR